MGENMPELRSEKRKKPRKKSKGKKIILIILCLLLAVFAVFGFFIWRVYSDVTNTTSRIYREVETEQVRETPVDIDTKEPFSVLLLGVDTGDLGRTEQGRSDTMMVLTINPNSNETKLVSIPRDTYTEIVGHGTTDKINHAYAFGGTSMSVNSVQNLLNIPIDYFVEVNMQGLKDVVDAVGGIDVESPLTFTYEGYSFTEGEVTHLDGETALAYSRMRYDDPNGDYGRQERQRQVIEAALRKVASFSSIMNYRTILGSLENNMQTNLSFDDMVDIFNDYRGAVGNIDQIQLQGTGTMMSGVFYILLNDDELTSVSGVLREQLELE